MILAHLIKHANSSFYNIFKRDDNCLCWQLYTRNEGRWTVSLRCHTPTCAFRSFMQFATPAFLSCFFLQNAHFEFNTDFYQLRHSIWLIMHRLCFVQLFLCFYFIYKWRCFKQCTWAWCKTEQFTTTAQGRQSTVTIFSLTAKMDYSPFECIEHFNTPASKGLGETCWFDQTGACRGICVLDILLLYICNWLIVLSFSTHGFWII